MGLITYFKDMLTTESAQWYETLPYCFGALFLVIEFSIRCVRHDNPINPIALGYMFSEGITVCVVPMFGVALAFNRPFANEIATKNVELLVVAMLVSFLTIIGHVVEIWFTSGKTVARPAAAGAHQNQHHNHH